MATRSPRLDIHKQMPKHLQGQLFDLVHLGRCTTTNKSEADALAQELDAQRVWYLRNGKEFQL